MIKKHIKRIISLMALSGVLFIPAMNVNAVDFSDLIIQGVSAPGVNNTVSITSNDKIIEPSIEYSVHIKNEGTLSPVSTGMTGGHGRGLRAEQITIKLNNAPSDSFVKIRTHIQDKGWTGYSTYNGQAMGTTGQSKAIEAIQASLTGTISKDYTLYYRVHCESIGNLAWVKEGSMAGSEGCSTAIEGVEFMLVKKNEPGPATSTSGGFFTMPKLSATAHIANIGDVKYSSNAEGILTVGTTGRSLAIEGVDLNLTDILSSSQAIKQRMHLSGTGWESSFTTGYSGTKGQSRAAEAIEVALTGKVGELFEVWIQPHVQDVGWMDWSKSIGGTTGQSKRLEAFKIKLVRKNAASAQSSSVAINSGVVNRLNDIAKRTVESERVFTSAGWRGNYQCNGFAKRTFYEMFGDIVGAYDSSKYNIPYPNANVVGILSPNQMNLDEAKTLLAKAQPGDFIQVRRRVSGSPHSMIVMSVDSNGVTILDANADGKNTIQKYYQSFSEFFNKNIAMTLLHARNYK